MKYPSDSSSLQDVGRSARTSQGRIVAVTTKAQSASPAVVLMVLAPAVGELLSGSAPPAEFFNPLGLVFLILLYGAGALLCRELMHRWDKGWPTLLVLGAAYGVIEEGLVVASFFNPNHGDLGALRGYDRWLGVNWIWSLDLTVYHAVFSIGACVLLVTMMFPGRRHESWVSQRAFRVLAVLFVLNAIAMLVLFSLFLTDFWPPPGHWLIALLLTVGLIIIARRIPHPFLNRQPDKATVLRPFWFGLVGFVAALAFFVHLLAAPFLKVHPVWAFLLMLCLIILTCLTVLRMSSRGPGMADRHKLALGTGALTVMALLAFVQEADNARPDNTTGMGFVGLVTLVVLGWLMWRTARREKGGNEMAAP